MILCASTSLATDRGECALHHLRWDEESEVPPALGDKSAPSFKASWLGQEVGSAVLDGRCGRIFAARLGKNGAVFHPLLARRIIRRIADLLASAHRRRAWTWLPGLVGGLGERRRGSEDRYGREDD